MVEIMKEQQVHLDAFEHYFIQKQNRKNVVTAVKSTASKFKVTTKSIYKWKRTFDWDGRESLRAAEVNKKLQEKTNESLVANKASYLSMIHNIFGKYIEDVERGVRQPLCIKNANDLVRLIGSALFIQGEGDGDKPIKLQFEEEAKELDNLFKIAEEGNEKSNTTKKKSP